MNNIWNIAVGQIGMDFFTGSILFTADRTLPMNPHLQVADVYSFVCNVKEC